MKTYILVTAIAIIILIVFQSFTIMSANRTEEQKYTVILKEKDFEIRFYPSATVATISFSLWRKRVNSSISQKHAEKRNPEINRFKCSRQRNISMNKISKR